ncbi:protein of unknown function [Xenorhabdus bovienii]|uniref:Uncharacterized protein n=1 Tax=Xenorhabdus bovienii TaxID=40576 RepID=A0A0B6XET9_XENBV|nr:protein of unknown function [Xenorhabdus bovienii]
MGLFTVFSPLAQLLKLSNRLISNVLFKSLTNRESSTFEKLFFTSPYDMNNIRQLVQFASLFSISTNEFSVQALEKIIISLPKK